MSEARALAALPTASEGRRSYRHGRYHGRDHGRDHGRHRHDDTRRSSRPCRQMGGDQEVRKGFLV